LSGVLHVPQVGGNLVSVARLIDCGYDVRFESSSCTITNSQLQVKAKRQGNLYYLPNEQPDKANIGLATNKSVPETIEVWHRRLGHRTLDEETVRFIQPRVRELLIQPGQLIKKGKEVCGTCATGRQHKEAITGTREKASDLLAVVHSDVCGPMHISTLNGEKYFITFVDEKSGRIAVTLLKAE